MTTSLRTFAVALFTSLSVACVAPVDDEAAQAASPTDDEKSRFEEEPEAPTNLTNMVTDKVPYELLVTANETSSGGTTNSFTVAYWNKNGKYKCSFTNGITAGAHFSCEPTFYEAWTTYNKYPGYDQYKIWFDVGPQTDGLLITAIGVEFDGGATKYYWSTFSRNEPIKGTGCSGVFSNVGCNSLWLDGDDHGKCTSISFPLNGGDNATCKS
jgi:hypothetical protein